MRRDDAYLNDAAQRSRQRREAMLEEVLRAATTFMVVVFGGGILTGLPFVPPWLFAAALVAVGLSLPLAIIVRLGAQASVPLPYTTRWWQAFIGGATLATLVALVAALTPAVELGGALSQLAVVLGILGVIVWVRASRLPDPDASRRDGDDEEEPG